jgi:glycine cleavage system regulatory protein
LYIKTANVWDEITGLKDHCQQFEQKIEFLLIEARSRNHEITRAGDLQSDQDDTVSICESRTRLIENQKLRIRIEIEEIRCAKVVRRNENGNPERELHHIVRLHSGVCD